MEVHKIPYADTGHFSNIVTDYLSHREDFRGFYHRYPTLDAFSEQIAERANNPIDRAVLTEVMTEQYASIELSSLQLENLNALSEEGAYTICTGHQLCLFSGPLYFIYKICSVINLARKVSEAHDVKVVPVFWMATEDHDFDEVDHAKIYGKTVTWATDQNGPVGRMTLDGIESTCAELAEILGDGERAQKVMAMIRVCYDEKSTLAEATRCLVQALFADQGVLCLDADSPRLKKTFAAKMKREILEGVIVDASADAIASLEHRGSKVQATPRDINLFYINDAGRYRIEREGEDYRIVDTDLLFSQSDFLKMLENEAERFSPNVVFRPVYQEFILPNLATIGGGGELAYWMELKQVFSAFDVVMPILILRNSHLIIDSRSMERWTEAGFGLMDMFRPMAQLQKEYSIKNGAEEVTILEEKQGMLASFDRIVEKSKIIDPNMKKFAEAEQARLRKSVEAIEKKLIRAEKKKHETALNRMEAVSDKLFPNGGLQERVENIIPFLIQYGEGFIDRLIEESNPLEMKFTVLIDQ